METERSAPEPGLRTPAPSSLLALPHGGHSSRDARAFGGGSPSPGRAEPRGLQRRREFRSRSGRTPGASPRFSTRAHRRAVQPVRSPEGRARGRRAAAGLRPRPAALRLLRAPPHGPRVGPGGRTRRPRATPGRSRAEGAAGAGAAQTCRPERGTILTLLSWFFFFFSLKNNSLAHTARWGSKE